MQARFLESRHISTPTLPLSTKPNGTEGLPAMADCIKVAQMRAGRLPPKEVAIWVLLSLPTHTAVVNWLVKPQNQASRKSSVVPVLPATR